jgi:hypothetical protein
MGSTEETRCEEEMLWLLSELRKNPNRSIIRQSLAAAMRATDFSDYRKFRNELADWLLEEMALKK